MNPRFSRTLRPLAAVAAVAAAFSAVAQESPYDLEKSGWYIRAGAYYQFGLSVSVNTASTPPTPTPGVYDNGYVLKDINNGADDLTWNWGYQDSSQVVDGTLEMSRINGLKNVDSLTGFGDGNLFGPEILVGFEFFRFDIGKRDARFGFELGLRYGSYSGNDRSSVQSDVRQDVDRYDLGGIVPPLPPYSGLYSVAGPLISLTPAAQPSRNAVATSTLATDLTADFYTGRFGAWISVPITEKFSAGFSAGYTTIYAYGTAEFTQTQTYSNPLIPNSNAYQSQNEGDWLPGAYVQIRGSYAIREWLGLYAGVEWSYNGALRIQGLSYEAVFDFGSTFGVNGGVQFSF